MCGRSGRGGGVGARRLQELSCRFSEDRFISSSCACGVPLSFDLPRKQPAEISQRCVGADREQLVVRIGVEHPLLCLDDVLVFVEAVFQRVAQRQRDVGIVDVEVVQIVPEEVGSRRVSGVMNCALRYERVPGTLTPFSTPWPAGAKVVSRVMPGMIMRPILRRSILSVLFGMTFLW